jgi:cytochrome c peroxidase
MMVEERGTVPRETRGKIVRDKNRPAVKAFILLAALGAASLLAGDSRDADLVQRAKEMLGPLPKVIASDGNLVTPAKAALGKLLFYETRISVDGTVSCARCHPFSLYGADGLRKSVGHDARPNPRNAPTVLNAAGQISAHWIGNRRDVEDQAMQSVSGPASFGMPSYDAVERVLKSIPGYGPMFRKAFPGDPDPVRIGNFALAAGAFERTLVTPSPFDDFLDGNPAALTEAQKKGLERFLDTGCVSCHSGPYVGGQSYERFGVAGPYWDYTKSSEIDEGRFAVTKNEADKYVFKVPILRNVAMTAPYFHDGSVDRLAEAVRIMGKAQLDLTLTGDEIGEIVAFLESLTGRIPRDALEVPLLPGRD